MPITKEQLQERAQLIRVWESACQIEHPSPDEHNFRIAIAKKIGQEFNLKELRDKTITGPISGAMPPSPRVLQQKPK